METIASNTPQLTQATPAATPHAGLAGKCARFTLRALRATGNAYLEAARCNPYWIGVWVPGALPPPRKNGK